MWKCQGVIIVTEYFKIEWENLPPFPPRCWGLRRVSKSGEQIVLPSDPDRVIMILWRTIDYIDCYLCFQVKIHFAESVSNVVLIRMFSIVLLDCFFYYIPTSVLSLIILDSLFISILSRVKWGEGEGKGGYDRPTWSQNSPHRISPVGTIWNFLSFFEVSIIIIFATIMYEC